MPVYKISIERSSGSNFRPVVIDVRSIETAEYYAVDNMILQEHQSSIEDHHKMGYTPGLSLLGRTSGQSKFRFISTMAGGPKEKYIVDIQLAASNANVGVVDDNVYDESIFDLWPNDDYEGEESDDEPDTSHAYAFFTAADFTNFPGPRIRYDKNNPIDVQRFNALRASYDKVGYWAAQVKSKLFPAGKVSVRRNPINTAINFENYQWARIYPSIEQGKLKRLAYTVDINYEGFFRIKLDTVGLGANDPIRLRYDAYRAANDDIWQDLEKEEILPHNWDHLIELTTTIISKQQKYYDHLYNLLFNDTKNPAMELNTILYGPPGTGKTYTTIAHAVKIANPAFADLHTRKAVKDEYDRLLREGQIVFTTFHQSMSYEDFVEGIKPVEPETKGAPLHYAVTDGIFKQVCIDADLSGKGIEAPQLEQLYDEFIESIRERLAKKEPLVYKSSTNTPVNVLDVNENDSVIVMPGVKPGIGHKRYSVSRDKMLKLDTFFPDMAEIKNVVNDIRRAIKGVGHTYFWAVLKEFKQFKAQKAVTKTAKKNYVLIIDEINRGNVSAILGELITLLEADKRAGAREALSITLPYSQSEFSVPQNLYIIGTMNTADRSVEALDTALRRRFAFEELMPRPELLNPHRMLWQFWWDHKDLAWENPGFAEPEKEFHKLIGFPQADDTTDNKKQLWDPMKGEGQNELQVERLKRIQFTGINLQTLLETINKRIEVLLNRDHLIGHSYFVNVRSWHDLKRTLYKNVIPLLQEYFFGDYGKIGLVMGNGFVRIKQDVDSNRVEFASFDYDDTDALQKIVYEIVPENKVNIELAIKSLFNK